MTDLAVIILAFNEEMHIERSIKSVQPLSNEIYVIDSFSTDRTAEIAKQLGAHVLQNKFINYSTQFQWALDNAPINAKWVMRLDADEIIEPDLQKEISEKLPALPDDVVGINLKRKHIFMDRWIKHGGRYPLVLLRIWRKGHGRIEDRWMDEHNIVWGGSTITFNGGFSDYNVRDLTFFTNKHNSYATREAIDVINQRYKLFEVPDTYEDLKGSKQASWKRAFKEKFYNKLPMTWSAFFYFIYRYFFQLGFLDGREGLIYHFLQGGWYRFLVAAKIIEYEREILKKKTIPEMRDELSRLTGYKL